MLKASYHLPALPPPVDLETVPVLKALARAKGALGELKGRAATIPNQVILIDTLALQEAKASSEIENIVTTQDEVYQAELFPESAQSASAKEVARYRDALKLGFDGLRRMDGVISNNTLIEMFRLLKGRSEGFRQTPGTTIRNQQSGDVVYVPPPEGAAVLSLMRDLEIFINEDERCALDPLVKMALIHHQFESIHPFSDGNGRIGRILNVLYLTRCGLLEAPILYLSRHITRTKPDYYRLLQSVRDQDAWEDWVLYNLEAVAETSILTLELVEGIRSQMAALKRRLRDELPHLYSRDLLNTLFRHPYTRIEFVVRDLGITRQTAAKYLNLLAEHGFVQKHKTGRNNYFINQSLLALFLKVSDG